MTRNMIKRLKRLLGPVIMGLLGFAACGENALLDYSLNPTANSTSYGTPYGVFKVDVRVFDEAGKPIKGIMVLPVVLHSFGTCSNTSLLDPIFTDGTGKASNAYGSYWVSDKVTIYFNDLDGALNGGSFASDSLVVKPVQLKKPEGLYSGEYSVSGIKRLRKK